MTARTKTPSFLAALAMAAALPLAAPASAGDDILVTSTSAMQEWQQEVTRDLDQRLLLAEKFTSRRPQSGIVQIRFELDENGKPVNLDTVYNSSGVSGERTASWAVRRLSNLDEVPVANASGARFQANIIYAESPQQKAEYLAELRETRNTRFAASDGEAPVIQLGS